jgi:hypothetical protein
MYYIVLYRQYKKTNGKDGVLAKLFLNAGTILCWIAKSENRSYITKSEKALKQSQKTEAA